jgi:hypothetical protein
LDVVLFGSAAREKTRPSDIDICLVVSDAAPPAEKFGQAVQKRTGLPSHVSVLRLKDFLSPRQTLWKTVFHEGISLLRGKSLARLVGFEPSVLFWYDLGKLKASEKVRFSYALYGRLGMPGLLKKAKGEVLGKGAILVPVSKEDVIRELFETWQIAYSRRRILLEM